MKFKCLLYVPAAFKASTFTKWVFFFLSRTEFSQHFKSPDVTNSTNIQMKQHSHSHDSHLLIIYILYVQTTVLCSCISPVLHKGICFYTDNRPTQPSLECNCHFIRVKKNVFYKLCPAEHSVQILTIFDLKFSWRATLGNISSTASGSVQHCRKFSQH